VGECPTYHGFRQSRGWQEKKDSRVGLSSWETKMAEEGTGKDEWKKRGKDKQWMGGDSQDKVLRGDWMG